MTYYLDTSVVVSAFVNEDTTVETVRWLRERESKFAISEWVATEFASALAMKVRTSAMSPRDSERSSRIFELRFRSRVKVLPIVTTDFHMATAYLGRHNYGLRATDALHLAIASSNLCTICTRDIGMMEAATSFGIPVEYLA